MEKRIAGKGVRKLILEKYHGCGNDFLIAEADWIPAVSERQVIQLCDRHFWFGADGLLIARRTPFSMELWNQDGTRAGMCGNGLRCFVHYAFRKGWIKPGEIQSVSTGEGMKRIRILSESPFLCQVEIGRADFNSQRLTDQPSMPGLLHPPFLDPSRSCSFWLGVPHTVVFVEHPETIDEQQAWEIGMHSFFKAGSNVDFVSCSDFGELFVRTWERGVGWTLACGTGACAAAVAAERFGLRTMPVQVRCPGGKLNVEKDERQRYFLTGPSVYIGTVEGELA